MASSPVDIKTPLTLQSSSFSSDSSEYQSSSFSMPKDEVKTTHDHDYASPQELKKQLSEFDQRDSGSKKKNLLYEPLPPRGKQFESLLKDDNSNSFHHRQLNDRCYKFLFVVIFLLSLGAFILSFLTSFGFIVTTQSCTCERRAISTALHSTDVVIGSDTERTSNHSINNVHVIHELQRNLSILNTKVIPYLLDNIKKLRNELNESIIPGPVGPPGPKGQPGIAGSGDLSKCRYKSDAISSSFDYKDPVKDSNVKTQWITGSQGYIILGASCSTEGGTLSGLYHELERGKPKYQCKCSGKTTNTAFLNPSLLCTIHWWECPIIS